MNNLMKKILVADDDANILHVICFALEKAGYTTLPCQNGKVAIDTFSLEAPDLIILDIGMPEMDGLDVCRTIRKTHETPILFLSARDEEIDRVLGLEIGGDDYVTKPFSPRELVARVGVILKRTAKQAPQPDKAIIVRQGCLSLDMEQRLVTIEKSAVNVTHIEFNIIMSLMTKPRMVHTREQILNTAYNNNVHVSDRTIDSHIRNIRHKMAQHGSSNIIETVHGTGFRLGPCTIETDGPE